VTHLKTTTVVFSEEYHSTLHGARTLRFNNLPTNRETNKYKLYPGTLRHHDFRLHVNNYVETLYK